ncbi:MAG: hypothetical protein QME77_13795 [bacterium]|nr:hypothetical protein [bacterium]
MATIRGHLRVVPGEDLPDDGPQKGDILGLGYWPGMKKTADLIPAFHVVKEATRGLRRPEHLKYHVELLRSLRFWRARHPISDAGETVLPTPTELRAYLADPGNRKKRTWSAVARVLGKPESSISYIRREVRAFRRRLQALYPDWPEMICLTAQVERAMRDTRGRPHGAQNSSSVR